MAENLKKNKKLYSFWEKLVRFVKFLYFKVIRIQATPEAIARGLAAGVFTGLLPLLPIQTICAILLAIAVRGSKIAAATGTWISNPLNWVPLYIAYFHIGKKLIGFEFGGRYFKTHMHEMDFSQLIFSSPKLFLVLFVGAFVIAVPSTIVTYFVSVKILRNYQKKREERIKSKELQKFAAISKDYSEHK